MTMKWIIMSLIALMGEPNPRNAMEAEVGQLCLQNKEEYLKTATEWTQRFAR